jgi:predicted phage terminase large subunit-like protein
MSIKRRDVVQSEWYSERWPKVRIKTDANLKTRFDNSATGYMVAATRKGGITGIRGSHIVMDDLLKVFEAYSEPFLKEANTLYDETLRSRFVDQAHNYFLGISQRLHENDIVGFLREKEPERWFFVDVPLECEEDTVYTFPISGKTYLRKKGDILLPKMFPPQAVLGFKKNPRVWSGQYQQKPSPAGGYIFAPDKWGKYDPAKAPDPEFQIMSLDATFKDGKSSDLVALHCYGVDGPYRWLLDRDTRCMDITATMNAIRTMKAAHPKVSYILIEDKANGPAIMQLLHQEIPGMLAIDPRDSKLARAHAASADQMSGHIILPDPEKLGWVQPFIDNFAAYNGVGSVKHDDDIDAMSQAINWLRTRNCGVSEWMQQQIDKVSAEHKPTSGPGRSRIVIQQGF